MWTYCRELLGREKWPEGGIKGKKRLKSEFESTSLPTVSWEVTCLSLRDVSARAIGGRDRWFRLLALLAVSMLHR
jgi:hypothetical protein